jgi:hypothetical protein
MKKTLLFLALLPSILFAQIGHIQTHEKTYEFVSGNNLYRMVADDSYLLRIKSDNQFENKDITLNLGIGDSIAMASLGNIFALYDQGDRDFDLQGYRFGVRKAYIFAYHTGSLEYAVGEYILRQNTLARIMLDLMKKNNLPLGDVHVSFYGNTAVFIHYDTYWFRDIVNFYNMSLPWSHAYNRGDVVSDDDLRMLLKAVENPNAYRSPSSKRGAYVLEKDQLINACNSILK